LTVVPAPAEPLTSGDVSFAGEAGDVARPVGAEGCGATVMLGDPPVRFTSEPTFVERCAPCQVAAPALVGAVAPGPPEAFEP
jgi:hypothetical protein